jgi:uncharacterized protein
MTFDIARKALDFYRNHSRLSENAAISFYGGEPLLMAQLIRQCIEYANRIFDRKPVSYNMTINGTLLSDEMCNLMVANDVDLHVSLDGPAKLHDRYRRSASGKDTFNLITGNLARLQKLAPDYYDANVSFSIVLAPPYDYEAVINHAETSPLLKNNRVQASIVVPYDTNFYDRFTERELLSDREVLDRKKAEFVRNLASRDDGKFSEIAGYKLIRSLFIEGVERTAYFMTPAAPFTDIYNAGGICIPGIRKLFVSADGQFSFCERVTAGTDLFCLGNVDDGIDAGKAMSLINKFFNVNKRCHSCHALRHCGVCFTCTDLEDDICPAKKERRCNDFLVNFKQYLIDMMDILERNPKALDYIKDMIYV